MKLQTFEGGLNTRVAPSLIGANEAVSYININNTTGLLQSCKEPLIDTSAPVISGYFYNFEGTWVTSSEPRSYVEYKNVLYWTGEGTRPQKFDGALYSQMGITGPTLLLTTAENNVLVAPSSALDADEEDPVENGISDVAVTLTYCYTYFDSVQGRESGKSPDSSVLNLGANKDALLSSIAESTETGVDKIRIYRKGGGIADYQLVMEVGNTDAILVDSFPNADIVGTPLKAFVGIANSATVFQYVYTYYNSQNGVESTPSPISEEFEVPANKDILVTGFVASSDVQVDMIRVYRLGGGATEFTLVRELPNGTTQFIDDIAVVDLQAPLLDSVNNFPPPETGRYLTEAYGIMFMAVGDKLVFSETGKPDYWPPANSIDFAKPITGMFPVPNGLLVFSESRTDILVGTTASEFYVLPISTEHGSISHYSGKLVKNTPTWVSLDGVSQYSGGVVRIISKDKLGKIKLDVVNSAVYDEEYYLALSDGSLMVMDARFNVMVFKHYRFKENVDNILTYDDTLYGRQGDKLVRLFQGKNYSSLTWLSPDFTEGEHSQYKLYNSIYIRYECYDDVGLSVRTYIDGEKVQYSTLKSDANIHELKVPADLQEGYSIQFGIEGCGKIYEIEYKVVGRQNGR